jgi:hypothetical protein
MAKGFQPFFLFFILKQKSGKPLALTKTEYNPAQEVTQSRPEQAEKEEGKKLTE